MDYTKAISEKIAALNAEKANLQREYESKIADIDKEIGKYQSALDTMREVAAPFICKACDGTGKRRRIDAAGQLETITCPKCKGTGIKI